MGVTVFEWGLLSPLYRITKDLLTWLRPKRTPPEEVVRLRQKWKEEIEEHLHWIDDTEGYGGAIIRDVKRVDTYPKANQNGKGISPWFMPGPLGPASQGVNLED